MAFKYETEQQFMESILRQVGSGLRRPTGDQAFQGQRHAGFNSAYDDFDNGPEEGGYERLNPDSMGHNAGPETAEIEEPIDSKSWGGYSSDVGRHSAAPTEEPVGMEPRVEMARVKKEIKGLERRLHELQAKKTELMRKITGRL